MGSDKSTGSKLAVRCCQGAYFALGFVITTVTFAVMFWIVWCYFGIAIVHISDSQRRAAVVNHSYTTPKPQPSPTTPAPRIDSSIVNNVVKSTPGTAALNRGTSRAQPSSSVALNQSPSREKEKVVAAPILNRPSEDSSEEEGINVRRVSSEVVDSNRPDTSPAKDESSSNARRNSPPEKDSNKPNIEPTQVYDDNGRSRKSETTDHDKKTSDETKPVSRDYDDKDRDLPPRRDEVQPSRRTDYEPSYEDSKLPRRYADDDDRGRPMPDRGSVSRFDRRDLDRDTGDRYPKQGSRIFDDDDTYSDKERVRRPLDDDRYRDRVPANDRTRAKDDRYIDRYPEDSGRRRDDERYYRDRDTEDRRREDRYRDRGSDSRLISDERDKDGKYIRRDDRYRDDDRYDEKYSEDDKYRRRAEDRIRSRDEDRYRLRDENDKYRYRDEDRYRDRTTDERDRLFDSRKPPVRVIDDDKEEFISRSDSRVRDRDLPVSRRTDLNRPLRDDKPVIPRLDDKIESSRIPDRDTRDRDRTYIREDILPSRVDTPPRIAVPESRRRDRDDEYRKVTRYDTIDDKILPTKTRDEIYIPQSSVSSSRSRNEDRYIDDRDEIRRSDDAYYDEKDKVRIDDSRRGIAGISRRADDTRDEYRTRVVDERRDEVVLDRRSYSSEEDDEYQRSRTRTPSEAERSRRPYNDDRESYDSSKRGYTDERPPRPIVEDDDYRRPQRRGDYDDSPKRYRDRPNDEYRRYDKDDDRYIPRDGDVYTRRDDDRYVRDDRETSTVRKYDRYPEDTDRAKARDPDRLVGRKDELSRSDDTVVRPKADRFDDVLPRTDSRDPYIPTDSRRYDDLPSSQVSRVAKDVYQSGPSTDSRRNPESSFARDPLVDSPKVSSGYSREASRVFAREKRYQVTESSRTSKDEYYPESREIEKDRVEDLIERPLSTKDVIETALRQTDGERQNRKVYYPAFDPRVSNLTSSEIIRASERRGTTITARRRRKRTMEYIRKK